MADLSQRGIVTRGGSYGLHRMLATRVGIEVIVAEDPVSCVAIGTGIALGIMDKFTDLAGL